MSLFKKKNEFKMDVKAADRILQNVFEDAGEKPNTVPFDKILLRCKYNGMAYDICIMITVILLAMTLMLPIKFYPGFGKQNPEFKVEFHEQYGDELLISLSRGDIDLSKSYFVDVDGNKTYANYFNSLGFCIAFPMPDEEVNIIITEESGKELHLLFTPLD
ncbi:MAG: hypothetical protein E7296_09225 [Lachnospiraceae bacterium]|jgi:hypothetical protein|nr:hypothetical protein [Lachnospiraceae bacterium]